MEEVLNRALRLLTKYLAWYFKDEQFNCHLELEWRDGYPQKDKMVFSKRMK